MPACGARARTRRNSSPRMSAWRRSRPPPPYSRGHMGAVQPWPAMRSSQSLTSGFGYSARRPPPLSSPGPGGRRIEAGQLSANQPRTSSRNSIAAPSRMIAPMAQVNDRRGFFASVARGAVCDIFVSETAFRRRGDLGRRGFGRRAGIGRRTDLLRGLRPRDPAFGGQRGACRSRDALNAGCWIMARPCGPAWFGKVPPRGLVLVPSQSLEQTCRTPARPVSDDRLSGVPLGRPRCCDPRR